jgi:hypothetical protein
MVTYGSCRHKYPFLALLRTAPRRRIEDVAGSASEAVLVARLAQVAVCSHSFHRDIVGGRGDDEGGAMLLTVWGKTNHSKK